MGIKVAGWERVSFIESLFPGGSQTGIWDVMKEWSVGHRIAVAHFHKNNLGLCTTGVFFP